MSAEMDALIDQAWSSLLARLAKKETTLIRPILGDELDIFVPQAMTLLLFESNPGNVSNVYKACYTSANRNVYSIMKKLGMPADYFWKFEYWPKERAYDTLKRVITRVFSTMLNQNKEGQLDLLDVDIEHMRFTVSFKDCAECAGIKAEKGLCFYHGATFAGIISALINREMDGYESKCHGAGDDVCVFVIGKRDDPEIAGKMIEFLTPPNFQTKIDERLDATLHGNPLRTIGNLVNIWYYRLFMINSVITDSLAGDTSFDVGVRYGTRLSSIIVAFYQDKTLSVIKKYYNQLRHLDVAINESGSGIDIVLTESPEAEMAMKKRESLDFICGELQGLVTGLLGRTLTYKENAIEGNNLKIQLVSQA